MQKHLIRGFIGLLVTLFFIMTISFFIIRLAPGGPFSSERKLPEVVIKNMEAKYQLDKPIFVQYLYYLRGLLRGQLGPSTSYTDYDVEHYIGQTLPNSALLGIIAVSIALFFGVLTGIISAIRNTTWVDYLFMSTAVVGISVPLFVIGPLLIYIFAIQLGWLPTSGWIGSSRFGAVTMIMPVFALSLPRYGTFARLVRSSMLEVLRSDYIRTARAKGLSSFQVVFKHALKGALLPVASYLGPAFASVITGSIVIEQIFRVPGVGKYFIQSAINRDYFLLLGTVLVYSFILIVMNFLVDLLYSLLDPRIAHQ